MNNQYTKPLSNKDWAKQANIEQLNFVVNSIRNKNVQVWAEELCTIVPQGAKCLEIGCGTGISSLWLANNGRDVTALDYTKESIELVKTAGKKLGIEIDTIQYDATEMLPFEENEFDYIFQCGLLEHFEMLKQIELLKLWARCGKNMVSIIPNASSLAYRIGKNIMENNNTWKWGLEIPKYSMRYEFEQAGFFNIKEYSIGSKWALRFLPDDHYLKSTISKLIQEGFDLDEMMQGYLLVTIGEC